RAVFQRDMHVSDARGFNFARIADDNFRPVAFSVNYMIRHDRVDVTIIAQAPKMLPHIPQMRVFIAEDLGCHMDEVNVKATTTE
ncbi:2-C-methyl-D-erythritol 2,4-cyclodiphosphate synthase, partial [Salmonella enterica subsp. enterica serovar Anatum]|nr:2-C-methyl-D-erythritol 2,4-cyclodiphosphate synthase [Salmonella enterica subsp. enterica serovar Anatum]